MNANLSPISVPYSVIPAAGQVAAPIGGRATTNADIHGMANAEWMRRPADERFTSLDALHAAALNLRRLSVESPKVPTRSLQAVATDSGAVEIRGATGAQASLTHWSFGQVAKAADAPASYLRTLPAGLAVTCLNHGLAVAEGDSKLLFKQNGGLRLRALTSDSYARIHHVDITGRLLDLEAAGTWQPAPAAFDGSRGLYMGDRDLFAFMVDSGRRIFEKAPGGGLSRGFIVTNSDVGAGAFKVYSFMYEYICGNHRIWGVQLLAEISIRHVGAAWNKAFGTLAATLRTYAEATAADDEARIQACMTFELGQDKDSVLDRVFGLKVPDLSRKLIAAAYDKAESRVDWYGSPRTAWGFAGGLTEIARDMPNADDRTAVDRAAGKVMAIAF